MAKLVLDHVAGFCQPRRKTVFLSCPWAKKGEKKKRKKLELEKETLHGEEENIKSALHWTVQSAQWSSHAPASCSIVPPCSRHAAARTLEQVQQPRRRRQQREKKKKQPTVTSAASPPRPRGHRARSRPPVPWTESGLDLTKEKKKFHSIGDSFALRADESFCLFCTHLSGHSQDLPVNHNAICLRAAFMRANISRVSKYAITAKFPVLYWTLEGSWDFKQCNDCMLHEIIMLSNNNWTLRLNNRQRKICSSSHCLPAAQTMTGPKLLIWYGKNPISCDRLFTQSPFMWGIPSWNVVNGHLHFVVLNSMMLTWQLIKKKS